MKPGEANALDLHRHALLARLSSADTALRACLHQDGTDAIVRAHLERALAHIREAHIAANERTQVRTVQELADQLTRIDEMRAELRSQEIGISNTPPSIRV